MSKWIESAVWSMYAFSITLIVTYAATGDLGKAGGIALVCRIVKFSTYPKVTGFARSVAKRFPGNGCEAAAS